RCGSPRSVGKSTGATGGTGPDLAVADNVLKKESSRMPAFLDVTAENLVESASPVIGAAQDYDPLLKMVGDSRLVLLGEATHGTHEFYKARAEITKRLIREKRFNA